MNRFACPNCAASLRFRLLPHVPRDDERFAFSCIHCGAVLEYSKDHLPLTDPFLRTRARTVGMFIGGIILLSAIAHFAGRALSLAVVGVLVSVLLGAYCFSKKPAYRVAGKLDRQYPQDIITGKSN